MEKNYSQKEIFNIWNKEILSFKKDDMFNVYVENPFCPNQCLYCKHMGNYIKNYIEECKNYYEKILPNQIIFFSELIEKRIPDTIYFGGGTPNIIPSFIMESIFNQIPNFKKIPNKVIEYFPNLIDNKKIKILIDNKFSYVSIGIQTLRDDILKSNHRFGYKNVPIKEYINILESSGIKVNCDLMAFINPKEKNIMEIERVKKDIIEIIEDYKPSLITVCPNTFFLRENKERGVILSKEFRKMILNISKRYNIYHQNDHLSLDEKIIEKDMETSYYLGKISTKEMDKTRIYFPNNPLVCRVEKQNVLSFGGYKNRKPHSYCGKNFLYYNINNHNKKFIYYGYFI